MNPVACLKTSACCANRVKYLETSRIWDSAILLYFHICFLKLKQINILCKNKKVLPNHLALEHGNIFVLLQDSQTTLCEPQEERSSPKLYTNQRISHTTVSLQGIKRICPSAANTTKTSNAYFGTVCQPNRRAGDGNDSYTRKENHRTAATSSFGVCAKRGMRNCCCFQSISGFSFWVVAHTQVKTGKLSVTWCIWSSDYMPSAGSNKAMWKKIGTEKVLGENTGDTNWGSLDPSEHNTYTASGVSTEQPLFPLSLISSSSSSTFSISNYLCSHLFSHVAQRWIKRDSTTSTVSRLPRHKFLLCWEKNENRQ